MSPAWRILRNLWWQLFVRRMHGFSNRDLGQIWTFAFNALRCEQGKNIVPIVAALLAGECRESCPDEAPPNAPSIASPWRDKLPNPQKISRTFNPLPELDRPHDEPFYALYRVVRTGWTRAVPPFHPNAHKAACVENVAEHSLKTMILASAMVPKNNDDLLLMALIHDQAEILVGDLTPGQISRAEKHRRERKAFQQLLDDAPFPIAHRHRLNALYTECFDHLTPNAQRVHIADKLDMALQASIYETAFGIDLSEFYQSSSLDLEKYLNPKNADA